MINGQDNQFSNIFSELKEKKIVLYGTGQMTSRLLSSVHDYNFVAVLDRDPEKIGTVMYGLPIVTLEMAEMMGDIIIINTVEEHWNVIYKRIKFAKIPVYFRNGDLAREYLPEKKYDIAQYKRKSKEQLLDIASSYDVVSFDMFDTLILREVVYPNDIFQIVEKKIDRPYVEIRNKAVSALNKTDYSLDELYQIMGEKYEIEIYELERIKRIEIETEQDYIVGRKTMIDICNLLMEHQKDIYIISDMYFSAETLKLFLKKCGLQISPSRIIVSCEYAANKRNGKLWEIYKDRFVRDRKALHIGDNWQADIEKPRSYGIDSYYIMSVLEMAYNSALSDHLHQINTLEESCHMGKLIAEKFDNPFIFSEEN